MRVSLFFFLLPLVFGRPELNPLRLLRKDLEALNCLFFRGNCTNHLADLSSANRLFWDIMSPVAETKLNTVRLEIYMESQCPDTSRFLHKQLTKAWASLGHTGRVDLTLIPFGKARCVEKGDDFECSCQHGQNECELNQLMNCVIERVGFPDKIVPIVDCIQGKSNVDHAMRECIANGKLLDERQMRECALGPRGRRLLALAGSRTVGLKPAMNFVPWIVIDGERNSDALYDLTENLCKSLEPGPEECAVYENKEDNNK